VVGNSFPNAAKAVGTLDISLLGYKLLTELILLPSVLMAKTHYKAHFYWPLKAIQKTEKRCLGQQSQKRRPGPKRMKSGLACRTLLKYFLYFCVIIFKLKLASKQSECEGGKCGAPVI